DPDKTIQLIGEYLKPGGRFIFSWDNPLMQCIDAVDGRYVLSRSYVKERVIDLEKRGSRLCMHNWKLSTYLNGLANHGFIIEQVVEESAYDQEEADIFQEGKYYSAGLARLLNNVIMIKARKR
ncbi:MAG: class I SAM-dependent methyltransferase, partial [Lachnospiraceae bacterium]|nr:class I SAM-dependent methyltransferase [Lachnospiraceae bacterium]